MKLKNIYLIALAVVGCAVTACEDELDVVNTNQQTSGSFGYTASELEEAVIACYNHTRMEGSYARVGYNIDVCRGDEACNASHL